MAPVFRFLLKMALGVGLLYFLNAVPLAALPRIPMNPVTAFIAGHLRLSGVVLMVLLQRYIS